MEHKELTVHVRIDRAGKTLAIDPPSLRLEDGDWVRWEFEGLEAGERLFLSFDPPLPRLGPFSSLRSFGLASILGKGNQAVTGHPYPYRAIVYRAGEAEAVATGTGEIDNAATVVDTAPEISVIYHPPQGGQAGRLEVIPNPVGLNTGDTATWRFQCLPPQAFASFRFTLAGRPPELGPFLAWSAGFGTGTGSDVLEVSGSGFSTGLEEIPRLDYEIELRDREGRLLATEDPAIDNLGPPPPVGV